MGFVGAGLLVSWLTNFLVNPFRLNSIRDLGGNIPRQNKTRV